jgi:hypothetical protein
LIENVDDSSDVDDESEEDDAEGLPIPVTYFEIR